MTDPEEQTRRRVLNSTGQPRRLLSGPQLPALAWPALGPRIAAAEICVSPGALRLERMTGIEPAL